MTEPRMKLTFFDEYWTDFRPGTTRRWYAPKFHAVEPRMASGYASLFYDQERKKYRVYYETLIDTALDGPRLLRLMESDDMKHFVPVQTERGDNVVFDGESGVHGCSVMYDAHETNPERRYKFCGMTRLDRDREGTKNHIEVVLAFSADGIHWVHRPDLVAHPHTSDALNKLFYNPCTEEYALLHRSAFVDRRVSMRTSRDLEHWSEPRILIHPGPHYNDSALQTQHYSLTAGWFDGIFYGLIWRYYTQLGDNDFSKMFGYIEPELVYSYDGSDFMYTSGRALIERPAAPAPGWAGLTPQDMCVSSDGREMFIICNGPIAVHGTSEANKKLFDYLEKANLHGGMLVYKIRRDGFCGLESVGLGARVVTKGIELLKPDLRINLNAACGSVRYGIMDASGAFLPGFAFDDCVPAEFVDDTDFEPRWKAHSLAEAMGKRVRLAFELNGATLHAVTATARPYIRQPQRSFADPQGLFE